MIPASDNLPGLLLVLLLLAGLTFLGYKLYQELRYRRKPFIKKPLRSRQQEHPAADNPVAHSVYLVGDFGNVRPQGEDPVFELLQESLRQAGKETTVVLLGDNVYPVGLPPEGHRHRQLAEERLDRQLSLFTHFPGRVIYLGGNHDWNKGRPGGLEQVLRQERYVEARLPSRKVYLPAGGQPGPVLVQASQQLLLIVLNTQWWVQQGQKPLAGTKEQEKKTRQLFFEQLEALLRQHRHRHVLLLGHHPLFSNAMHGGNFALKQHLFPLTAAHKKLYMPLPILGSLFPLYRQFIGAAEDISFPKFRKFRKRLLHLLNQHQHLVYAAGHEHNLQHFALHHNHYIVSGAASKTAFVAKGGSASFVYEHLGFFRIDYHQNGEVWLYALVPDLQAGSGKAKVCYRTRLMHKKLPAPDAAAKRQG